jgi:hypothetical protein
MVRQFVENVGHLACTSPWFGKEFTAVLVFVAFFAGGAISERMRQRLWRGPAPWLLLGGCGALLPFAPSLAGNYGRFLYMAAPLFCPFVMHLLASSLEACARPPAFRRLHFIGAFVFLLIVNLFHLEKRILADDLLGQRFRLLSTEVHRNIQAHPEATVTFWIVHPSHYFDRLCVALDFISPAQVRNAAPTGRPPRSAIWFVIDGRCAEAPRFTWEFGEQADPVQATEAVSASHVPGY